MSTVQEINEPHMQTFSDSSKSDTKEGGPNNGPPSDMTGLTLQDIMILKMFLEKANRENLFLETEKPAVYVIHKKMTNLIEAVLEKNKK